MKGIEGKFNDVLLPFMLDGRWYTSEQLNRIISHKNRKGVDISSLLSKVFWNTRLLERKEKYKICFPERVVNHGRWTYRIKKKTESIENIPQFYGVQLRLCFPDLIVNVQDTL